jgi:hypothetical protein
VTEIFCPQCRLKQPTNHSYCVRCGRSLPAQLLGPAPPKRTRSFAGIKVSEDDPEGAFLRVSCYLKEQVWETEDGTVAIPGSHVRFSVWVGDEAKCVISIPHSEAKDLARFISEELNRLDHDLRREGTLS